MMSPDASVAHATVFCYLDVRFNTFQSNCSLRIVSVVCFFELSMSQYLNVCVACAFVRLQDMRLAESTHDLSPSKKSPLWLRLLVEGCVR